MIVDSNGGDPHASAEKREWRRNVRRFLARMPEGLTPLGQYRKRLALILGGDYLNNTTGGKLYMDLVEKTDKLTVKECKKAIRGGKRGILALWIYLRMTQ